MPAEVYILWIFSFLTGAAIGSFLNVVIYRVPAGISIVTPPSRCPGCETPLKWYWNIPIFGWIFLRGKCAKSRMPIAARYPVVEFLTGLLAFLIAYQYGPTPWAVFQFVFVASLVAITFIDIDHMIIPDVISLPGIIVGLVGQAVLPGGDVVQALIAVLIGGGGFWLIAFLFEKLRGVEGLGGGDVKLLAMIGAFTSPIGVLQTILVGSLLGSIVGVAYLAKSGKGGQTRIPFGPFLAFGALSVVLLPGVFEELLGVIGELQ